MMGFTKKEAIALLKKWSKEEEEMAKTSPTEFLRALAEGKATAFRAVVKLIDAIKTN